MFSESQDVVHYERRAQPVRDFKLLFMIIVAFGMLAAGWWFGWFGPMTNQFHSMNKHVVARPSKPATYKNHGWPIPD